MIHGRPLSCLKVNSLLMVCPAQTRSAEVVCEGGGPGGGGQAAGPAASVASGFVISGAYPV